MWRRKSKAQSFIGYAILIAVVVAALLAMRVYLVRIMQEKFRQAADTFGQGEQYEKGRTLETTSHGETFVVPELPPEPKDLCGFVCAKISLLEGQLSSLSKRADDNEIRAAEVELHIPVLLGQGLAAEAQRLTQQVNRLRQEAAGWRQEAAQLQERIKGYKDTYPDCACVQTEDPEAE